MSTIKVINAIHPSGSTNNIVLDNAGNATIGNGITVTGTFTGSTGVMNIGSGQLYKDASGNVGIGTSSPAASLSVVKQTTALSGTGNAYGLYMYPTSSGLTYIDAITGSTGNTSLGFRTYNNGTYNEMRIDSSGNLLFNSGYGSAATAYGCRAWVNFNGTSTVAIRASGNVTSITDNGTGDYTVNFTTAMPDANYAMQVVGYDPGASSSTWVICGNAAGTETAPTTSAIRFTSVLRSTGAAQDTKYTFFAAFR